RPTFVRSRQRSVAGAICPCLRADRPFCIPGALPIIRTSRRTTLPFAGLVPSRVLVGDAVMGMHKVFELAARAGRVGMAVTWIGLIVVLFWIGGLKAFRYEADGIVPFVATSPLMSFFYADPEHYPSHMNPEGKLVPENQAWHEANHTYEFAYGLGAV